MGTQETVDLFVTKWLEYLLVVGYLIALAGIGWALRPRATAVVRAQVGGKPRIAGFELPDDRWYYQGHTWVTGGEGNEVTVGLDDFAGKLLGSPMFVALPRVGERLRQGAVGLHVALNRERIPVLAPVDGEITETNRDVVANPDLMVTDPYGAGWLFRVRLDPAESPFDSSLLSGSVARAWMTRVAERLHASSTPELGTTLADGGMPVLGLAQAVGGADWVKVAREYLLTSHVPKGE